MNFSMTSLTAAHSVKVWMACAWGLGTFTQRATSAGVSWQPATILLQGGDLEALEDAIRRAVMLLTCPANVARP
jgi:hypothetical protein